MSLSDDLDALFTAGFEQLYPIYGAVIDVIEYGSGNPELLLPGTDIELDTDIRALKFPLSKLEKDEYATGYGEDLVKFLFATAITMNTSYLIQHGTDKYEISNIVDRSAFGRYRVIAKRSEDV